MNIKSTAATLLLLLAVTLPTRAAADAPAAPTADAVPNWIWLGAKAGEEQTVLFRKAFTLPADLTGYTVHLWSSCDNVQSANFNGQSLGFSTEWEMPMSHD